MLERVNSLSNLILNNIIMIRHGCGGQLELEVSVLVVVKKFTLECGGPTTAESRSAWDG